MAVFKILVLAGAAGLTISPPAAAQMPMHMPGMSMPGMNMPDPNKPAAKKAAAKKWALKAAASKSSAKPNGRAAKPASSRARTSEKGRLGSPAAKHDMSSMPGMDMHAGHDMPAMHGTAPPTGKDAKSKPGMETLKDHDMSSMPGMTIPAEHEMKNMPVMPGHDMNSMSPGAAATGTDLAAGSAPPPPVPSDHAADAIYGAPAMAIGRDHLENFHGGQKMSQLLVNVADYQFNSGRDGFEWVGQAWYGGDINRLWLKSEGDGEFRRGVERAEVQALYNRAIGPYFNLQAGVRYDFKPNPSRTYATVGVEGLAPSFFDIEAALFLSNKGELLGRVEGSYDQRITQRLILQPRVEVNAAAQSSRSIGVGSGLSDAELGMRLRYDFRREFSPYVGVQFKRTFGATRRYLREAGDRSGGWSFLTGIRAWF